MFPIYSFPKDIITNCLYKSSLQDVHICNKMKPAGAGVKDWVCVKERRSGIGQTSLIRKDKSIVNSEVFLAYLLLSAVISLNYDLLNDKNEYIRLNVRRKPHFNNIAKV